MPRTKSERTVIIYGQAITFFSRWLEAQGREASVEELNRAAIREWLAQLADVNEASTVKTRYRGLFRFCGWLVDEDELTENPMKTLSPPQPTSKPVPVLSDAELEALMKTCAGKEFRDRRDEAMIRLLLDCGLRVSELCALTVDGVDLDQGMAIVRGKGRKFRPIYFGARTTRAIDRYLRARGCERWAHLDALFITQRGPLSADGARERMSVRGAQAGIEDLHPHKFRHTWAHDFLINGDRSATSSGSPDGPPTSCSNATAQARPTRAPRLQHNG